MNIEQITMMTSPGERLREKRGEESQETFGDRIGTSQAQLSRIERGDCCPTAAQAVAIEKLHGIAISDWPWEEPMAAFVKRLRRRAG